MTASYKRSQLALILEKEYNRLYQNPLRPTDDSDEEEPVQKKLKSKRPPSLPARSSVMSTNMTIQRTYHGKDIRLKGNQLILFAREIMSKAIETPNREKKIVQALNERVVIVKSPNDWLDYEGMFDNFFNMPAKKSKHFEGILIVNLNEETQTTVEFKIKMGTPALYAQLHDEKVIGYLKRLGFEKYTDPNNYGLSYYDIVTIIEQVKKVSRLKDAEIAQRQLKILKCLADGEMTPFDLFLAFFNAVLFGSEASRNSLSFLTGILVLDFITKEKLTYDDAFRQSASNKIVEKYAVYPMASSYAGSKNIVAYNKLLELSEKEKQEKELSSRIGMQASRMRPQWLQIQLKEALLLNYWMKDMGQNFNAVDFARRFCELTVSLLREYFNRIPRLLAYSREEMDEMENRLGWISHREIWEKPESKDSTVTAFNAFEWTVSPFEPLKMEKILEVALDDLKNEIYESIEGREEVEAENLEYEEML